MFEKVTIRQFTKAWFFEEYDELSQDDFDVCYSEYIDETGLYVTEEFDVIAGIHYLNNRINTIKTWVSLQKQYVSIFGRPFEDSLVEKYGFHIKWNGNIEDYEKQLDRMTMMDTKFHVELNNKYKKLEEIRSKRDQKEMTKKDSRVQFIRMLNSLGKIGYNLDKDQTTVEELALMLKQQYEELQQFESKYGNK